MNSALKKNAMFHYILQMCWALYVTFKCSIFLINEIEL